MWTLPPLPALHLSVQTDTDPERAESPTARSSTPSEKGKQKQLLGLKLPTADELSPGLTTPVLRGRSRRRWVVGLLVLGLFVLVKNMSSDMGPYPRKPEPLDALQKWGVTKPRASQLLNGLSAWPHRGRKSPAGSGSPYSNLGAEADNAYNTGPTTLATYSAQLHEFVAAFPKKHRKKLLAGLDRYLTPNVDLSLDPLAAWDANRTVWQTDEDGETKDSESVHTWNDGGAAQEGWNWTSFSDDEAWKWAIKDIGGSSIGGLWASLPTGILRADLLRYLLLLLHGGIYTDTDTHLIRPPSQWTHNSQAWKGGEGWMSRKQQRRLAAGEPLEDVVGKPSVVVGIEADVGDREDWHTWWPRPLQIVQWTMASAPAHPIALQSALRVLHATAKAATWAANRARKLRALDLRVRHAQAMTSPSGAELRMAQDDLAKLQATTVLTPLAGGGPVSVLDWTGPGVWTDATLDYLAVKYGVKWVDLRGLTVPTRIGDVLVLPVTGFSPGVGQFGAGEATDPQAMVWHQFRGSWRRETADHNVAPMLFAP